MKNKQLGAPFSGLRHLLVYLLDVDEQVIATLSLVGAVGALDAGADAALCTQVSRQRRFRAVHAVAVGAHVAAHEPLRQHSKRPDAGHAVGHWR